MAVLVAEMSARETIGRSGPIQSIQGFRAGSGLAGATG